MTRAKSALLRVFFLLSGGHRLDGRDDEFSARAFHLLLAGVLLWLGFSLLVVVPFFAVRKAVLGSVELVVCGAILAALVWLRRGRNRAAAALFLGVSWCAAAYFSLFGGGVRSGATYVAMALSLHAAWLLGRTPALGCAAATLLISFIMAVLESTGHPLPVYFPGAPMVLWAGQLAIVC